MNRREFIKSSAALPAAGVLASWRVWAAEEGLPAYYADHLARAAWRMRRLAERCGEGFFFITDLHIPSNARQSGRIIAKLIAETGARKVFCGGDLTTAFGEKESIDKTVERYREDWVAEVERAGGEFYPAKGNHDFTIRQSPTSEEGYTYPQRLTHDILMDTAAVRANAATDGDDPEACYYYVDDAVARIRFIVADTTDRLADSRRYWQVEYGMSRRQVEWLAERALATVPEGWGAVVVQHVPSGGPFESGGLERRCYAPWRDVLDAYQNRGVAHAFGRAFDFTGAKGRLLLVLGGHHHFETQSMVRGIWHVSNPCDAAYRDYINRSKPWCPDLPEKKKGTVFEQTFDAIHIDRSSGVAHFTRIGGGADRVLHLDVREVEVGAALGMESVLARRGGVKWGCYDSTRLVLHPNPARKYDYTAEYFNEVAEISDDGALRALRPGDTTVVALAPGGEKEMFGVSCKGRPVVLEGLSVDHLAEPANIGPAPSFGWRMASPRRGAAQTAYRIRVFERSAEGDPVWDSGEVASARSVAVPYGGSRLKEATRYMWDVRVKDETGEWSGVASAVFTTGLFGEDSWRGSEWIASADAKVRTDPRAHNAGKQEAEDGTSCFAGLVPNAKAVREAWLAVAGLGVFEAYVNGEPVSRQLADGSLSRDFLKPGFTHNGKTKYSFTYDVTHLVKKGAGDVNVVSAQVSSGWWSDKIVNFFGERPAFRAVLILRHDDGSETRVGTGGAWLAAVAGPVLRAAIFDGEDYDARVKTPWMVEAAADDLAKAGFRSAVRSDEFKGELLPMVGATVSLRRDLALPPKEMYVWSGVDGATAAEYGRVRKTRMYSDGEAARLSPGETLVVDFAQNAAAVPEFVFSGPSGACLTVRPAEMLNDGGGAKSRGCDGPEGSVYTANYRKARTTMNYIFAGEGDERYHPGFTFFGYRYLSITATDEVTIKSVRSLPVTSIAAGSEAGSLVTGVADVNRLVSNSLWGQYSNYLSIPTDCPQRNERLGWTADTQVFSQTATYNAEVYGFFLKWMRDMRDSQAEDGSYPGVAPVAQYGGHIHQLGWSDAGVIVPYTMWLQYGDTRIVDENWESMVRYMDLVERTKYASRQATEHQWADWLSYEKLESWSRAAYTVFPDGTKTPRPEAVEYWQYLGCAYWLMDARMMARMAAATGRTDDAAAYREMAARALAYLRGRFVDEGDGMLLPLFRDMQTPALFALKLGIVEGEGAVRTRDALLKNIADHGDCLQTGFLGTSILMDTLAHEANAPEVAYTLLLQHKNPSWLYSVDQGATTIWERWNSYTRKDGFGAAQMNSFNHYAYGAVLGWMYGTMAGVRPGEEGGFKHFVLAPVPDRRMGRVEASFRSSYGWIKSAWSYEGNKWRWSFTVPANTTAEVTVPGEAPREYAAGEYTVVRDA